MVKGSNQALARAQGPVPLCLSFLGYPASEVGTLPGGTGGLAVALRDPTSYLR